MVNENQIDSCITRLEDPGEYDSVSQKVISEHPALLSYLASEGFDILTEDEKDLLWYCILVLFCSVEEAHGAIPGIKIGDIADAEDANFALVDEKKQKFTELADIFFAHTQEEDLLAFVEDTLVPDPEVEEFLTPVGRKVLLITLKTMIDVMVP